MRKTKRMGEALKLALFIREEFKERRFGEDQS